MHRESAPQPELSVLNKTAKLLPGPDYLHHLVRASSPTDAPAVDFLEDGGKRRELTYRGLHTASDVLARRITDYAARLEHVSAVIPVLLPQSPELYVALLAVLKAGRAFCPIGLDSPPERIAFILQDISAGVIITSTQFREKLSLASSVQPLLVDDDHVAEQCRPVHGECQQYQSRLAYVLYTSGSTGLPKAVSVSHRAVTQSILAHDRHIPPFSRFLQFAAPTFDVSIFEIFFPLYRGCTLVGRIRQDMLNDLSATIALLRADAAELTPTVVSNLLRGRRSVPGLKLLLTIGEMLTKEIIDEFGGSDTQPSMLWGMYGPTETAIHCTLQPSYPCSSECGNIGVPLDTVTALIAAPSPVGVSTHDLTILPWGDVGELVIGGPQVADEYINRPDLTSASFFHNQEYGYLYRTGDKARICSDGKLECLGRITSGQLKLRGQRIELGEIEQAIIKVHGCYSAVVIVIEDTLVAFCAVADSTITREAILESCRRWLPNHMVPTHVIFVDCMPQLPSGKVDKKALETNYMEIRRQPNMRASLLHEETDDSVASIFRDILGQQLSDDDEFTSIGLDSLQSIRLASRLRQQGYNVGSLDILAAKTLKEIRDLCMEKSGGSCDTLENISLDLDYLAQVPELQSHCKDIVDILPCTPIQEAMLTETVRKSSAYCNWIEVELLERHSFSQIREAIKTLMEQNEILRTGFCVINAPRSVSGQKEQLKPMFTAQDSAACKTSTDTRNGLDSSSFAPTAAVTSAPEPSFVQVVWKEMHADVVVETSNFSKAYSLGSIQSLLRPFTVQIDAALGRPRLLFQMHHAIYDGWSFDLLLRDLNELLHGNGSTIRPQFREIVRSHLRTSESTQWRKSTSYWRNALREYHPKPLPNFNGKKIPSLGLRTLRGEYAIEPKALFTGAKTYDVHPQILYQTAMALLTSHYVGSSDVVIGSVTSGRTIPVTHVEQVMGPCISTLPCRLDLSYPTVKETLKKTHQINRSMLEHGVLPLRDISKSCQLRLGERLFDVLFVWQESLLSASNRDLALKKIDSADDLEFKLTLEVETCEESVEYRVTYDPSTIPQKQAEIFAEQVHCIVQYFLANHNATLEEVRASLSPELLSVVTPQQESRSSYHGPAHAVRQWAATSPNKDAVVLGSMVDGSVTITERLSYALLNARANQLAHALLALGASNDRLVCVMLEKSINLYVSILAILKTGCGYLPIVPDTPSERTRQILADAEVKICVSKSSSPAAIGRDGLILIDPDDPDILNYSEQNIDVPYDGSHLAYAVFTSGSTGAPKGVLVTQDNLMSNLNYLSTLYPYKQNSRLLQSCSQAFDVSAFEIFFSWHVGICLCTATKDDLFFDFEAAINSLDVTHLSLTPTVASLVDPVNVPKVEFLVTAGEALTEVVKRKWAGKGLYQGYGPSETTNICTVKAQFTRNDLINNIGPVFPNTSLLILEPNSSNVVPRGGVGELCFGGAQVFRGYLNRPDLNATKLIGSTYGRIYRSGDLGQLLPNGDILSTGRLDDQVKIRGQRVELGEIIALTMGFPTVRDCTVLLVQNGRSSQRLVVFWVPKDAALPHESQGHHTFTTSCALTPALYRSQLLEIFDSLSLHLPAYMLPTHIIPIGFIPMTPQAKIDKRTLHSTFEKLSQEHLEATALGSVADQDNGILSRPQEMMANALSQTLGLPIGDIKRSSSFFNLGLDSVSAIKFAKRLRDVGFGNVPVSAILKYPTLEHLSTMFSEQSPSNMTTPKAQPASASVFNSEQISQIYFVLHGSEKVDRILPCTPLQEAMLAASFSQSDRNVHTQINAGDSSYHNVMLFAVHGDLDRLRASWDCVVRRHDILRTAFVSTDHSQFAFAQVVLKDIPLAWDEIDAVTDVDLYANKVLQDLLMSHEPPVRLAWQIIGTSRKLVFCCHHALYDGLAMSNLLDEVQKIYLGQELLTPVPYEAYLQHMLSGSSDKALNFWAQLLAGFEPTYFPYLSGKLIQPSKATGTVRRVLRASLSTTLANCRANSYSLLSVVQAAWAKLLYSLLAEDDICFGNVVSGRTIPENDLDRLVAPCFNTLPVRLAFDFQASNIELCKKLHALNVDMLPYQLTPLRRIQSKAREDQDPLFDTLVILQQPSTSLDASIWQLESDYGQVDLPIVCEVAQDESSDTLTLVFHHRESLCQKSDATTLAEIYDYAFQSLLHYPTAAAGNLVGLPSNLLGQSNMNPQSLDTPNGEFLHSAFENNATSRPDTIALEYLHPDSMMTTLTFYTLNEKANQVAHSLIQSGVTVEDVIPVYMEKIPDFYISILGILKAGAAFSPIHPDLPQARKKFMISELQPKLIVARCDHVDWLDNTHVINVTRLEGLPTNNPTLQSLRSTNIAYCLYTSGSTGLPKAVIMEHRSPMQTIESSRSRIPWDQSSRLLQYAATTFDMCYYDCFLAWTLGFTLCAANQDTMINHLTESINSLKVDLLDLTPSVAISLRRSEVPNVKWLYCIGEVLTSEVVNEWEGACVNSYGPTEAAFCTTIFETGPNWKTSVIGKPFQTTSFAIFSPKNEWPVPIFGLGELYIGGHQLAREYYGKRELTQEKFVRIQGLGFYKSGDIVRMLRDGNFEFLRRNDEQVKIRGLRVELGEINRTLIGNETCIRAVTTQILRKNEGQKEQLVAFLVLQRPLSENERVKLKHALNQKAKDALPSYMVPQFYIFVDRTPKSMAGKIDKKALTKLFRESAEATGALNDDGLEHQWNQRENSIREIISRISGLPKTSISPTTTIFQLGLDSISAVQVAAALRKQGMQATATDVMKYANCKELAANLEHSPNLPLSNMRRFDFNAFDRKHRETIHKTYDIDQSQLEAVIPCTPLQNAMLSQFVASDGKIYFNYIRLRLVNGVDSSRLRDAWKATVQKHSMLRTGFMPVRDHDTSFAMLQYAPQAQFQDWEVATENFCTGAEWLRDCAEAAVRYLQQPPWRIRISETANNTYIDVAILHAIYDAQSLLMFFNDISAFYHGNPGTSAMPLEPVIERILHSSSKDDSASNDFWKELGQKASPTRFPNLAPLRYDPAPLVVLMKPSTRTLGELEEGCRTSNISLQAASLASWATLLSAYVGEPCVTFGVVLSGRSFEDADDVAFPCISTVPFSCTITDDKNEVLKQVMSLNAELQQHQFTPLNHAQKLMGYPSEQLFDSMFAFQKFANERNTDQLWTVVEEQALVEYPLSIELEPSDGRLEYRLTFLPHIIPQEQADLILDQLDELLNRYIFAKQTDEVFCPKLHSITPAKVPQIASEIGLLHEFVEQTAAQFPQHIAFEFATSLKHGGHANRKWTYEELDGEGNRIANLLISHGIMPGELVSVCFEKCPEASFAMLGILKAGCAFVALDPGAPSARKEFILKDSGAPVMLSMAAQSASFEGKTETTVINLDEVKWELTSSKKPVLAREINPQDRSYCLYTSGTTGTPKGCELSHENAVQAMLAFKRLFSGHWDANSRWLQFASFHFDVSILEQYWSWSVGICVVSAPRDLIFEDLAVSIRSLRITHIDLTPSLARIIHPDDVPTLCKGVFITGGESLKQEILDVWGPKGVIYNGYGPTEATIGCTMYPRVPANGKPSNIGPQFDNVGSFVLRPGSDIPVLRGGVGELCVSGPLVGKGYLKRPELTKERFAHLQRFDERVYRTGDLVRIFHDGTFDFLGRADDQVKLRGQRLEIGEINSVIKKCGTEIVDVATVVLKHPKQQKEQLVSFVILESSSQGQAEIILRKSSKLRTAKQACEEKLPPYMVPTHFVSLTSMPLSANNKVEVRKLKELYEALSIDDLRLLCSSEQAEDELWTKQEGKIRDVLKDTLNINENSFSKDANFYELGMDSITVIGVSRALKQAGLHGSTAAIVLKNASVRRLSKAIANRSNDADGQDFMTSLQQRIFALKHQHGRTVADILSTDTEQIEAIAPCTPLQQGMIAKSLESDKGLYFNSFYLDLHESLNIGKLRDAWQKASESTEILRTVFVNTGEGFVQAVIRNLILPFDEMKLSKTDLDETLLADRRKSWVDANRTHIQKPLEFILVEGPQSKMLILHMFHGLYDANSISIVLDAVWSIYHNRGISIGPSFHSALAYGPLRLHNNAREFWESHLSDRRFQPLPRSNARSSDDVVIASREILDLPGLSDTRRRLNVTTQAIVQACWIGVLHQYLETTVTMGIVISGRSIDLEDADKVAGPLFNTIPYQYCAQPNETWNSMIKKAHDFNVAAHPYQHTPIRDIMKWLKRSPNEPLFDNLFVFQVLEEGRWKKNDLWSLQDTRATPDFPLALEVEQNIGSLKMTLVTQGDVLNLESASQLLQRYEEALRQALVKPITALEVHFAKDGKYSKGAFATTQQLKPALDGHAEEFQWNSYAGIIRREIAALSGMEVEEINASTSIFEYGLDSIDALRLSSKLSKQGVSLPVSSIMRNLNIANMMQHITVSGNNQSQQFSDTNYNADKKRLESYLQHYKLDEDVEQILPMTPLQEAMVAEMMASDHTRYYNHDVLKLRPKIDLGKLKRAFTEVVKNSPILRTSFILIDDPGIAFSHAQVVHKKPHSFWRTTELNHDPSFDSMFDSAREEARTQGESQPLFHVDIICTPRHKYLMLSIAHALYDGWSLNLLHADVYQAYNGTYNSRPDWEPTLRETLTSSGADAVVFWRDYLSGAKPSCFPHRHDPAIYQVHRKEKISNILLEKIVSFAKEQNITLQTLGQTVYAATVASYTKSLDVVFGSILSGRDDEMKSELLFPIMNTVAIRAIMHGSRREMLRYVQDNFSNIAQWQHFPLRKAMSLANVHGKSLQSLFIYQKTFPTTSDRSESLYESVQGQSDVEYPVCVEMEAVGEELIWRCAVQEEVFDEAGAQELLKALEAVTKAIITEPDAPIMKSTDDGISVCDLPAFQKVQVEYNGSTQFEKGQKKEHSVSPTADTIREILALVSQTPEEDITADMTIFHIGLDSISAIKVASLLRKHGITLSVGEIIRAGTVDQMAYIADEKVPGIESDDENTDLVPTNAHSTIDEAALLNNADIHEESVERVLPVTAGQLYMLSGWLNSRGANFYAVFDYRFKGDVSLEAIKEAWKTLVMRNTILRTLFLKTDHEHMPYVQVVLRNIEANVADISNMTDTKAASLKTEIASKQPYAHIFVSKLESSTSWNLQLKIHHALYDGVSLPLIVQQLQGLCSGMQAAAPMDALPALASMATTQSAIQNRKSFWTKYLDGMEQQLLPQPNASTSSRTEIFMPGLIPSVSALESQARRHGLTTQSIFLSTCAKVYASLTASSLSRDIVIGLYLANRSISNRTNLRQAAVPTLNLVPLRVTAPLESSILEVAVQIQRDILEISAPANASVSLWEVKEWTGVKIDTFVNFLKLPTPKESFDHDIKIEQVGNWGEQSCGVVEMGDGVVMPPKDLIDKRVNGAYLYALDIEATLRNGGLDVGIFAPVEMLAVENGKNLMRSIKTELELVHNLDE